MLRFSYPRRIPGWAPVVMTIAAAWVVHSATWKWRYEFADLAGDIYRWARDQFSLHGISRSVSIRCAMYLSYFPAVLLHLLLGAILGFIASHQWRKFATLFAISLMPMPYALESETYLEVLRGYGWKQIGFGIFTRFICMVPAVFLGAWLASQPRKRRRERRREAGLSEACGYSLAGNTTGKCPECGLKTGPNTMLDANPTVGGPP